MQTTTPAIPEIFPLGPDLEALSSPIAPEVVDPAPFGVADIRYEQLNLQI